MVTSLLYLRREREKAQYGEIRSTAKGGILLLVRARPPVPASNRADYGNEVT